MKLLLSYIIGLFLILSLSACHDGGNATTLLRQADSLMQEFPDRCPVSPRIHFSS